MAPSGSSVTFCTNRLQVNWLPGSPVHAVMTSVARRTFSRTRFSVRSADQASHPGPAEAIRCTPRLSVMNCGSGQAHPGRLGLLQIEDCVDADGGVALPPGATLISLIDRNIANVGDATAYRYLDYARAADVHTDEVTWTQFGARLQAIGARLQQVARRGERVAILEPQGIDYVAGFYAAIKAGTIAVPLFAPELPGHAERLNTALRASEPAVVLTTAAAKDAVEDFLTQCAQ